MPVRLNALCLKLSGSWKSDVLCLLLTTFLTQNP